jgi:hypothetical protein
VLLHLPGGRSTLFFVNISSSSLASSRLLPDRLHHHPAARAGGGKLGIDLIWFRCCCA